MIGFVSACRTARYEMRNVTGRRLRPGDSGWPSAALRAYARAAADAHLDAVDLARRASALVALLPKLRAKPAGRVVALLLADDGVTPAVAARATGMSDRAARRLFDRLVDLGGARELTGRDCDDQPTTDARRPLSAESQSVCFPSE